MHPHMSWVIPPFIPQPHFDRYLFPVPPRIGGWVGLVKIPRWYAYQRWSHPRANRARCRVSSLITSIAVTITSHSCGFCVTRRVKGIVIGSRSFQTLGLWLIRIHLTNPASMYTLYVVIVSVCMLMFSLHLSDYIKETVYVLKLQVQYPYNCITGPH